MDIEYKSSTDINNTHFEYGNETYKLPFITLACVSNEATDKTNFQVKDPNKAINTIRKVIRDVVNHPDLDEAVKVTIVYEGISFHHSISLKEGVVYGRYGFIAEFFNQPCKIGYLIDKKVVFLDPKDIKDKLDIVVGNERN